MKIWAVEFSDWDEGPYVYGNFVYRSNERAEEVMAALEAERPGRSGGYSIQCYEVED